MRIIAVCPAYEMDPPNTKQRLEREVSRLLAKIGGSVHSASGRTAALAVNYCERHGYSFKFEGSVIMNGGEHRYYVERTS